tara:strand:- start:233 stop:460 length:228 start_codon:yes stop_codon:yes gene_type:complete
MGKVNMKQNDVYVVIEIKTDRDTFVETVDTYAVLSDRKDAESLSEFLEQKSGDNADYVVHEAPMIAVMSVGGGSE